MYSIKIDMGKQLNWENPFEEQDTELNNRRLITVGTVNDRRNCKAIIPLYPHGALHLTTATAYSIGPLNELCTSDTWTVTADYKKSDFQNTCTSFNCGAAAIFYMNNSHV